MKKIMLITDEGSHRLLYGRGLAKQFDIEFASSASAAHATIDAVIYDLPKSPKPEDYKALERLQIPIVILTPEIKLPLPKLSKGCVLQYPVGIDQMLQALIMIGVSP